MKRKKNEENEKAILYKQYQQQNDAEEFEEQNEEDNLEAEEKRKNLIVYGMMAVLGLLIIFLLVRNIYNKESTSVIYKNGGNSDRVIKTNVQQSEATVSDEQGIGGYIDGNTSDAEDLYNVDENISGAKDLYEIAVENGFVGTREGFYDLLSNWNYSADELEMNIEKLQELIKQIEDGEADGEDGKDGKDGKNGKDGENGKDGKDGENGKDGKDGKNGKDGEDGQDGEDGLDGKDAYEIAVENGFMGTREEWLESMKGQDGKDGAFSGYNIVSQNNNVYLYKDAE